jgi:hypothetical protein
VAEEGAVRLVALAWLIERGLRQTACSPDASAVDLVAPHFRGAVDFEDRGAEYAQGVPFDLSDRAVLFAVGAREALAPVWDEHRRALSRGPDLGRALGYFAPRAPARGGWPVLLHHYAAPPGRPPVGLWIEVLRDADDPPPITNGVRLLEHLYALGLALREVGLTYTFDLEKAPR